MDLKARLADLWETYRWQILAALAVGWIALSCLTAGLHGKTCALRIMLLDCRTSLSQQELEQQVLAGLKLDENQYTVEIQAEFRYEDTQAGGYAMTSLSRFLADVGSEKLDVCAMLEPTFRKYEQADAFLDLRTCFTPGELETFGSALFVTDEGRVAGLYADRLPGLQALGCYSQDSDRGILGIIYNTTHLEQAKQYLLLLAGS